MNARESLLGTAIRKAVNRLNEINQKVGIDGNFTGMVHPLQYSWIQWRVHPYFDDDHSESQNMRDQLEAEYLKLP